MSDGSDVALEPSRSAIGPYEIVKIVGRGATGTVYSARKEGSAREVAVKVLQSGASDETYDRFAREISIARGLVHRHIVRVLDSGEDDDAPFLVMELLHGKSLRELLRQGQPTLDLTTRIDIVAQLCTGLHYAHEHGLVHRDVKPANVFLTEEGVVKILDFGVAKLTDTTMTAEGSLVGTLAYMAPEQLSEHGQIDGRADVFSAAVVLYELVTGSKPFEADSTAAMVARIVHDDPAPVEGMPDLDLVLRRALHKDPSRRFATAQDFAHALWQMLLAPRTVPLTEPVLLLREEVIDRSSPSVEINQGAQTVAVTPLPQNRRQIWLYSAVAAGGVGAAIIGAVMWNGSAGITTVSKTTSLPSAGANVPAPVAPPVPPSSGVILLESTPSKATITSSGKDIGQTPAEVSVTVGQQLQFSLAGHETSTVPVDAASVSAKRLSVALAPLPRARLQASGSYPFQIVLGGRVISSSAMKHDLSAGFVGQVVRLQSSEYLLNQSVTLGRAGSVQVAAPGTLSVRTLPRDERCRVFIDSSDLGFPPLNRKALAAGAHEIELRCPDGSSKRRRTELAAGDAKTEAFK